MREIELFEINEGGNAGDFNKTISLNKEYPEIVKIRYILLTI